MEFSPAGSRRGSRRAVGVIWCGGPHGKELRGASWSSEQPLPEANKEIGTPSYNCKELKIANKLKGVWKWILPQGLQIRGQSGQYLNFSLVRPWVENPAHPDFWPTGPWENKREWPEVVKFVNLSCRKRKPIHSLRQLSEETNTSTAGTQREREKPSSQQNLLFPF